MGTQGPFNLRPPGAHPTSLPGLASFLYRGAAGLSPFPCLQGLKWPSQILRVQVQADTSLSLNSWERAPPGAQPDPMHSARAGGVWGINVASRAGVRCQRQQLSQESGNSQQGCTPGSRPQGPTAPPFLSSRFFPTVSFGKHSACLETHPCARDGVFRAGHGVGRPSLP